MTSKIDITAGQITHDQLEKLRHTLGLNYQDKITRNYFHSGPEGEDSDLVALKEAGLMYTRKAPAFCEEGDVVFHATEDGKAYALERQLAPVKIKKTVWQKFLDSDLDRFTDFLEIEAPRYEESTARVKPGEQLFDLPLHEIHLMPFRTFYRMVSPRGAGEWCETKKSAKASYKADMKARRQSAKEVMAEIKQIAASA